MKPAAARSWLGSRSWWLKHRCVCVWCLCPQPRRVCRTDALTDACNSRRAASCNRHCLLHMRMQMQTTHTTRQLHIRRLDRTNTKPAQVMAHTCCSGNTHTLLSHLTLSHSASSRTLNAHTSCGRQVQWTTEGCPAWHSLHTQPWHTGTRCLSKPGFLRLLLPVVSRMCTTSFWV